MKGQPAQLHVVSIDPQPPDFLQIGPGGVEHQVVVQPPARTSSLSDIDVMELLSPPGSGFTQLGEEGADLAHRLIPAVRQVLVIVGEGHKQVAVVKVGGQSSLQLLKGSPGVELLPGSGAGPLLLGPGLGAVPCRAGRVHHRKDHPARADLPEDLTHGHPPVPVRPGRPRSVSRPPLEFSFPP